jgi:hypothetical protein
MAEAHRPARCWFPWRRSSPASLVGRSHRTTCELSSHVALALAPDADRGVQCRRRAETNHLTCVRHTDSRASHGYAHCPLRRHGGTSRVAAAPTAPAHHFSRALEWTIAGSRCGCSGADQLVRNADVPMYVSKHGGKGRLSHFEATPAAG